jgi:hypothetical protein
MALNNGNSLSAPHSRIRDFSEQMTVLPMDGSAKNIFYAMQIKRSLLSLRRLLNSSYSHLWHSEMQHFKPSLKPICSRVLIRSARTIYKVRVYFLIAYMRYSIRHVAGLDSKKIP